MQAFFSRLHRDSNAIATLLLLMSMAACASLGLQSVANKYQLAVTTETALLNTASDWREAGVISKATLAEVVTRAEQAKSVLDEALSLSKTDLATAEGKIATAKQLLADAQTYLNEHKEPPP